MADEARTLRRRHDDLLEAIDRRGNLSNAGSSAVLVKTATKTTYPTTAARFYWCQIQTVTGTETEGGAGTLTADSTGFLYALNLGTAIPPVGTALVATYQAYLWVFRYDG